ncbi:hypothetical protein SAMN05216277_1296 [Halolamina pelagica]|uniref:Uncharacterized protein n=1 Tax=Halolamina pelagica TaxID=699431 RepID=A0A1I5WF00_9EURY|nr:hypothetical protein SAMN05216277_1296 [Halolamina pelagica]
MEVVESRIFLPFNFRVIPEYLQLNSFSACIGLFESAPYSLALRLFFVWLLLGGLTLSW